MLNPLIAAMLVVGLAGFLVAPSGSAVSLGDGALDLPAGQIASLPVRVSDIAGLYGFELHLSFDPAVVEVVDADPQKPGIQIGLGDFLAADFVAQNLADNQTGKIDFAMTQINPHEAKAGSGVLLKIDLRGRTGGQATQVLVTNGLFSDRDGTPISVNLVPGTVRVVAANPQQPSVTPSSTSGPPNMTPSLATATPRRTGSPQPTSQPEQASAPTATRSAGAPTLTPTSGPLPTPVLSTATPLASIGLSPTPMPAQQGAPVQMRMAEKAVAALPSQPQQAPQVTAVIATDAPTASAPSPHLVPPLTPTATSVLLARVPAGDRGKPILAGHDVPAGEATISPSSRSGASQPWLLAAAGVVMIGAALGLIVALLYMRHRRRENMG